MAMRILVVEDEAVIAMMVADCLERRGHAVLGPATTLTEALALCEERLPDLAMVDINLRDGSSGVALARALVERWELPVIFASGQMIEARRARALALGYLRKPYEPETVCRSVEVAVEVLSGGTPRWVPDGFELFHAVA
jgi:CheY-like chemotaxis protein